MSDRPWLIAVVFVAIVLVSLPIIARNNKKKLAQYEQQRRDWVQTAGWTYHGDGTRVLAQFPVYPFAFPGLRNPSASMWATGQLGGRSAGMFDYFYSIEEKVSTGPFIKPELEVTTWPRTANAYLELAQPVPPAFVESSSPHVLGGQATGLPLPESQQYLGADRGKDREVYIATADPRWAATLAHPALLDLLAHPDNQAIQVITVNNWLIVQDSEFPARPADKLLETLQQVHAIIGRL